MVNKNLILALVVISTFTLSAKTNTQSVLDQELSSIKNFNSEDFVINKDVEDHKELQLFTIGEDEENKTLVLYFFNVTGYNLLDVESRVSMSFNADDDYKFYDLEYIDSTADYKFYKFKMLNFSIDFDIEKRNYSFGEIQSKQERTFIDEKASGIKEIDTYHASDIGSKFVCYADSQGVLQVEFENLQTITLETFSDVYRIPGNNGNSNIYTISQTDVFYSYFKLPRVLGDLVGLRMSWNEEKWYKNTSYGSTTEEKVISSNNVLVDYTSEDKKTALALDWSNFFKSMGVVFSPGCWFLGLAEQKELSVIEKVNSVDLVSSDFEKNYCVSSDTKNLIVKDSSDFIFNQPYLIRFDLKDYCIKSGDGKIADYYYYNMEDISYISLTFYKNGLTYTIPVVSDSTKIINSPGFVSNEWWKYIIEGIGIVLLIVLVLYLLPYIIQLISWIIKLPGRIINSFKKKK
jgi:hypothetical protein